MSDGPLSLILANAECLERRRKTTVLQPVVPALIRYENLLAQCRKITLFIKLNIFIGIHND